MAHLLNRDLVREGRFPAEQVRELRQMQRLHEDADYDSAMLFDEVVARQARQRLLSFQAAVTSALEPGDDAGDRQ